VCKHSRADFFAVVKRKNEIRASFLGENTMRSALPCDAPSGAATPQAPGAREQTANSSCRGEDLREFRNRFTVFDAIREDAQCQSLDLRDGFGADSPIGHHTRQDGYLGNEPPVSLFFYLDPQHELVNFQSLPS
jgi:hypothetical protein